MTNDQLAAHHAANPHNLPRVPGFPALCPMWACAARFMGEGRAAYASGARNPYNPGTMANERFAIGWHMADNAKMGDCTNV